MSRTISARLSQIETEALDALARQKGVSRSQLLASIAKQALETDAKHAVDNVDNKAGQGEDAQNKQDVNEAIAHVFLELPFPFTCPGCGETSRCATLCPQCGKLLPHGCSDDCPANAEGWLLSEMYE